MFIRKRNSNWSLERAVYKPAVKDAQGTIITHPVRTTEYVGSVKGYGRFAHVPGALLERLSEEEKGELREALRGNEPQPDYWLNQLDQMIRRAATEIQVCVAVLVGADAGKRKLLDAKMRAIDDAWRHFFKTAQEHGLKRKSKPPAKVQPTDGVDS